MCGNTRRYTIRIGVIPVVEKTVETRLRWFGHIERRPVDYVVKIADQIDDSQITRGIGRPRKI
jgi:hypothetical protein